MDGHTGNEEQTEDVKSLEEVQPLAAEGEEQDDVEAEGADEEKPGAIAKGAVDGEESEVGRRKRRTRRGRRRRRRRRRRTTLERRPATRKP